ncbi:hypothetical protein AXX17_AT1G14360 [Arabidopsis thaliana]|uniref:Peptidase C1A papain C-terminal domain-containing protein n=1 Tax=Arabidopsis thaliana TaxID=3702 RepID=A0A178WDQ9_ARATH|nr:hypothetical protein AXX17_AT1G14360 [Arabidopsis thaliana]
MLLTGHGIDEESNIPFMEFQDTKGDTWGDEGFVRVRRQVNLVTEFVELKVEPLRKFKTIVTLGFDWKYSKL